MQRRARVGCIRNGLVRCRSRHLGDIVLVSIAESANASEEASDEENRAASKDRTFKDRLIDQVNSAGTIGGSVDEKEKRGGGGERRSVAEEGAEAKGR